MNFLYLRNTRYENTVVGKANLARMCSFMASCGIVSVSFECSMLGISDFVSLMYQNIILVFIYSNFFF